MGVSKAPKGKAPGVDELFVEALQASETEVITKVYWRGVGLLSMLYPLLKKEPADRPQNWRAIALLNHCRKLIEKIGDMRIRELYRFHAAQCEFVNPGASRRLSCGCCVP